MIKSKFVSFEMKESDQTAINDAYKSILDQVEKLREQFDSDVISHEVVINALEDIKKACTKMTYAVNYTPEPINYVFPNQTDTPTKTQKTITLQSRAN